MALISKPNTFFSNTTIVASEHNDNFDTIYNCVNGNIENANISSGASISYSKLSLSNSIVNADINSSAAIADSKLAQITTAGKVSASAITNLASIGGGILPIANGGTGASTAQTAIDALLPAQGSANGKYLTSNGSISSWGSIIQSPITLISNTNISSVNTFTISSLSTSTRYKIYFNCILSNPDYFLLRVNGNSSSTYYSSVNGAAGSISTSINLSGGIASINKLVGDATHSCMFEIDIFGLSSGNTNVKWTGSWLGSSTQSFSVVGSGIFDVTSSDISNITIYSGGGYNMTGSYQLYQMS